MSKVRQILFIMSIFSIPDNINENISSKFLSESQSHVQRLRNQLRIIRINLNDQISIQLRNRRTPITCSWLLFICCKSDLIIKNYMNSSADTVIFQHFHLLHFIIYSLSTESSIAMDNYWKNFFLLFFKRSVVVRLSCFDVSNDNWIDHF